MNIKCHGCSHQDRAPSTDFCYMLKEEPKQLPCGQHDKYKDMRKAFGKLLLKNPFLMHLVINNTLDDWRQDSINDMIDEWHRSDSIAPLHEFLGLTLEEYKRWVEARKEAE